jgi:hypothetical protein
MCSLPCVCLLAGCHQAVQQPVRPIMAPHADMGGGAPGGGGRRSLLYMTPFIGPWPHVLQDKFNAITVVGLLWVTLAALAVGSWALWGTLFAVVDERVMHSIRLARAGQGQGTGVFDKNDCRNPCRGLCKVCGVCTPKPSPGVLVVLTTIEPVLFSVHRVARHRCAPVVCVAVCLACMCASGVCRRVFSFYVRQWCVSQCV